MKHQDTVRDIRKLILAPSTELQGGSRWASHSAWRVIFAKYVGGAETHSKAPTKSWTKSGTKSCTKSGTQGCTFL